MFASPPGKALFFSTPLPIINNFHLTLPPTITHFIVLRRPIFFFIRSTAHKQQYFFFTTCNSFDKRQTIVCLISSQGVPISYQNKSITNDCVIPHHCKHFHSPIFSNIFIFSVSTLCRAAKPHGAWNKIYVCTRHFITLISYYKLSINHFLL